LKTKNFKKIGFKNISLVLRRGLTSLRITHPLHPSQLDKEYQVVTVDKFINNLEIINKYK